ncbi:MAG: hypothetical protein M0R17_07430 [Candidatus Omnitrophica bacterium]|jgi:hypothetical protein|nr:hypothetical protein [Candidatus Omnitrophota bacterium]
MNDNLNTDLIVNTSNTDREKAIEWWNVVMCENTSDYCVRLCQRVLFRRDINTLTNNEIEQLWRFYNIV